MIKVILLLGMLTSMGLLAEETKSACGNLGYFGISTTGSSFVTIKSTRFENLTMDQVKLVLSVAAAYPMSFCMSQKQDGDLVFNN